MSHVGTIHETRRFSASERPKSPGMSAVVGMACDVGRRRDLAVWRRKGRKARQDHRVLDRHGVDAEQYAAGSRFRRTADVLRGEEGESDQGGWGVGRLCFRRERPRSEQRPARPKIRLHAGTASRPLQQVEARTFVQRMDPLGRGGRRAKRDFADRTLRTEEQPGDRGRSTPAAAAGNAAPTYPRRPDAAFRGEYACGFGGWRSGLGRLRRRAAHVLRSRRCGRRGDAAE